MKKLCVIPARGGSKRIPKKNIKDFFGKPLIAYSIETAIESNLFDKIIVSTDSKQIAKIATKYGAEVQMRPDELSDDFTGTFDVVRYVVETLKKDDKGYDYVCTIYPTAPLLQSKYLIQGFDELYSSNACYSFSATSFEAPTWWAFKIQDNRCKTIEKKYFDIRSQDLEETFYDAGQFYWEKLNCKSDDIFFGKNSIPIILPRYLVQDIDTLEDWERAEIAYQILNQDRYDGWNSLKKKLNSRKHNFYIKQGDIYFLSIGQNIGYEAYGKDELFLRPVLVFKKLNRYTFIGIPLTSKTKIGSHFFSFKYKKDKLSTAQISQMRMFDIKRIEYRSGRISNTDFSKLKDKVSELLGFNITSQEERKLHSKKLEQRNNANIIPQEDKNVK